jgi:hypothetical protein
MIKKAIISLFFVFFQLDNFCFSQIQYNIFKNQNEGIVQWTDESQSPVEIQLDNNIATLRGNPEDSFFFVIHEGTSEEKEVITVNFALDESCVKLSYTDESNELEDKELKLGEFGFSVIDDSIHDLLDFWVDNQKEKFVKLSSVFPYRIKITRQNNHKLVLIFAPGGNGELLSFAHFSIQSTMHPSQSTRKQSKKAKMLPNKNRNKNKNKKKKEKKTHEEKRKSF